MSLKRSLGKLLLCVVLEIGALAGVPVRPDELEQVLQMNQEKVVGVVKSDAGDGDERYPPPP